MVDKELLSAVKDQIVIILGKNKLVFEETLWLLLENVPGINNDIMHLAISESVQDNLIKRIEIKFPGDVQWDIVYVPLLTQIR